MTRTGQMGMFHVEQGPFRRPYFFFEPGICLMRTAVSRKIFG